MALLLSRSWKVPFALTGVGVFGTAALGYVHFTYPQMGLVGDLLLLLGTCGCLVCTLLGLYLGRKGTAQPVWNRPDPQSHLAAVTDRIGSALPPAVWRVISLGGLLLLGVFWGLYPWAEWIAGLSALLYSAWRTSAMVRSGKLKVERSPFFLFALIGGSGTFTLVGYLIGVLLAAANHVGGAA